MSIRIIFPENRIGAVTFANDDGEPDDDEDPSPAALERWAEHYDALNGAPESEEDR